MKRLSKSLLVSLAVFSLAFAFLPKLSLAADVPALPTPTIYSPTAGFNTTDASLLIDGVTFNGTRVAVYIDDVFNGYATVREDVSGVASWAYRPFLPLKPGEHSVFARAENLKDGRRSSLSSPVSFTILVPYSAPTLKQPVVNSETTYDKPWVVGLAKNNSKVKFYLDGQLDGELQVINDPSGVASFKYQPSKNLKIGSHLVYAIAVDGKGKESKPSSIISFEVKAAPVQNVVPTEQVTPAEQTTGGEESEETIKTLDEDQEITEPAPVSEVEEETGQVETEEEASTAKKVVGWGILGVLLVGIVYQRRNGLARVFKRKKDSGDSANSADSNVQVITKEPEEKEKEEKDIHKDIHDNEPPVGQSSMDWEPKDSQPKSDTSQSEENKDDVDSAPPPPPPASHY